MGLSGIRKAKLYDKSDVRCVSDYAVSAGEPYQGCVCCADANGGTLRVNTYDNPVPSLERGRCNDYRFVTEYNGYWYAAGSARQLFQQLKNPMGIVEDIV